MNKIPLAQLQRQLRRAGKIRLGKKVAGTNRDGKAYTRPSKLTEFRLTSPDRSLLEHAAKLYGGTVQPWAEEPGQFELLTESNEIYVRILNAEIASEYEFWKAGGCIRRCDGEVCRQMTKRGEDTVETMIPCPCNAGVIEKTQDQCKLKTRIDVQLAGIPALGTFVLDTNSVFAAQELPAMHEFLTANFGPRYLAILAIEERESNVEGQAKKEFIVPVLRVKDNMTQELRDRGGIELQELRGVAFQALAPRQVIDADALPEPVDSLPPASEHHEDVEDERITDQATGEVLETTATSEHVAAMAAAAVPISGEVVEPHSFNLTTDASDFLEFCKIDPLTEDEYLMEVQAKCGLRGYNLSEFLIACKALNYGKKGLIKSYAETIPVKGAASE
jgi:hypothetical protein